jgi:hypothetical protein
MFQLVLTSAKLLPMLSNIGLDWDVKRDEGLSIHVKKRIEKRKKCRVL